jgi:flagella basal body P-ring formation protein FlgA
MLCPLLKCLRALATLLACLPLLAFAQGQPAPAPQAEAQERALQSARQWVAQSQQLPLEQVRFAALDSRVRLQACGQPLTFDYPFTSSRETVRMRCPGPVVWQIFLRLLPPATAATPAGAAPPAAAASAAGATATAPVASVPMRTVVVTRRLVQRGSVLDANVAEEVQRPAQGLDTLAVQSLKDVEQAEAIRDLPAGTVLRSYDIKRSLMVRKGQTALMTVGQSSGFQITVRLEAQQDGYLGEQIRLKNPESGRLLSGVVTGPNAVRGLQN